MWIKVKVHFHFNLKKGLDQWLSVFIHIFMYVLPLQLFFYDSESTICGNFGKGLALDLGFCSWIWIVLQLLHKEFLLNSQSTVENAYNMSCFTITGIICFPDLGSNLFCLVGIWMPSSEFIKMHVQWKQTCFGVTVWTVLPVQIAFWHSLRAKNWAKDISCTFWYTVQDRMKLGCRWEHHFAFPFMLFSFWCIFSHFNFTSF